MQLRQVSKYILLHAVLLSFLGLKAQDDNDYRKRVLESTEISILSSYYEQQGNNAAVSGGIGTEELNDVTPTIIVSVPLNADDVLTIDAGLSAYSSASSSNVNPFDGANPADPFQASSGASSSDLWMNFNGIYSHTSKSRNSKWSAKLSLSNEYDYSSLGFGGSYAKLFNEKNTEISLSGTAFLDVWQPEYPIELRAAANGGQVNDDDDENFNLNNFTITGNPNYNPRFEHFQDLSRNTYSIGLGFSQILNKKTQFSLNADFVQQQGLLSTPFQRVYFADVENSYIENFHLADAIEILPSSRFKVAVGTRFNYYLNQKIVARSFYRFYTDNWNVNSHTVSLEVPVKMSNKFTIYPSYRFYVQSSSQYFAPYDEHLSTSQFYTSDYDLSAFSANQYAIGLNYTDVFTSFGIGKLRLKSFDISYQYYHRNNGFNSYLVSSGVKLVWE